MKKALLVPVLVLVAGCGGGGDEGTDERKYSMKATQACLKDKGVDVRADTEPLTSGSGGNLRATVDGENVFLSFAADEGEVSAMSDAVADASEGTKKDKANVVETRGNVLLYTAADGDEAKQAFKTIEDCLKA